jgi:NADH-quinone oxidoreductase subunit L
VQTISYLFLGVAWIDSSFDTYVVNPSFDGGCSSVSRGGRILSLFQGGRIQSYLRMIGLALVALVIFLLWGAKR